MDFSNNNLISLSKYFEFFKKIIPLGERISRKFTLFSIFMSDCIFGIIFISLKDWIESWDSKSNDLILVISSPKNSIL